MAVTTITLGRKPAGSVDAGSGFFGTNTIRATVFNRTAHNVWIRRLGARLGSYTGVDIDVWLAAYIGTDAHVPDNRIGYVGSFIVPGSTIMTNASGGANFEDDLDVVGSNFRAVGWVSGDAAMLRTDKYIGLAIENDGGGTLGHGMIQSLDIDYPADDTRFFIISNDGSPPDPFGGGYTTMNEGHLSVWAIADVNKPPNTPVNRTETGLDTLTPTFLADFRDENGVWGTSSGNGRDVGDSLYRVNVIIRNPDGSVRRNAAYYASADERDNDQSSYTYDGSALTAGTTYTWEIRHSDQFNEWGSWSAPKSFTPTNTGSTTVTAPSGKQLSIAPNITGVYTHPSATAAASARVIIKQGASTIDDSGWFAKAVSSGASWSITFAAAGLDNLAWGNSYTAQVAFRTAGLVETPYASSAFTTDSPPTTPTGLYPTGSVVVTSYPLLYANASDPDNLRSELTMKAEVTKVGGSTVTATMAYNASANRFEFQTTSTQIPSTGDYTWVAYVGDGTLWSGTTTVEASAERSSAASFTYSTGPSISITSPADTGTFDTSTPTVTWAAATQVERSLTVKRDGVAIFTLPREVSAVTSYTIPAGYIETDGTVYVFEVTVWNSGGLPGTDQNTATLDYDEPDAVTGIEASPHVIGTDPYANAIRVSWNASTNPQFYAYVIKRDGVVRDLAFTAEDAVYIDYAPVSGNLHEYSVQVMIADDLTSVGPAALAEATITIDGIVVHSLADPDSERLAVRTWIDRDENPTGVEAVYLPMGAIAPTTVADEAFWDETSAVLQLGVGNGSGTGREQRERLRALARIGGPLFYRDATGAAFTCSIPRADGLRIRSLRHDRYEASVMFRQEEEEV